MSSAPHTITIVITDSGLGGLSTTADLYKKLTLNSPYERVNIIYFNALADNSMGYNNMDSTADKIAVFNNALYCMTKLFQPDYILIACNTLSVLHQQTEFSKNEATPIIGIVETGIKLILDYLVKNSTSNIVILGTKTTYDSNLYPQILINKGIHTSRIISEACSTLHLEIENNANSSIVKTLIKHHLDNALINITDKSTPLGLSLNCTHYDYVIDVFENYLKQNHFTNFTIISPNTRMTDFIFENSTKENQNITPNVQVISQAQISDESIHSTGKLLAHVSTTVSDALKNYTLQPNLFDWKSICLQKQGGQ